VVGEDRERSRKPELKYCLDLSHHDWTRPPVVASTEAMQRATERTIQMIEAADRAGLDSAWVSEDPDGWDAFAVLAAAARTTTQIRLGTGVTNPYLRHPNTLAMSMSTLDRMSGGRAFLGLGRGQPEWYRDTLGGTGSRSPLRQLETTMHLLRQWWQPPYRAYARSDIPVRDWARAIWPAQERVPIYLAALGPRALDLAARRADGLLIADFASMPFLEWLIPDMKKRIAGYGRDPDSFHFYVRSGLRITENPEGDLRYRKTLMAILAPLPGMSRQVVHPDYDIPLIIEQVDRAMHTSDTLRAGGNFIDVRRNADFAAARTAIPDGLIRDISYVGTAEWVRAKVRRLREIGATHIFLGKPDKPDPEFFLRQMEHLADPD
jgi:5,10-methylenetetrahydromethanopterin reductase